MENEKKKGKGGIVIIIVLLLLVIAGLVVLLLKEKNIIKIGNNTKETKVVEKIETKDSKKTDKNEVTSENKIIYSGENLTEDKDFGKVSFGGKKVIVKYLKAGGEYEEGRLYVGDKYIDFINSSATNIAIMGDYLVVGIDQDGYRFEIYNSSLEQVDKVGNSLGFLSVGTSAKTDKWLIDENNLIYYDCVTDETSSTSFRLDLYNLKIDGSKIEKVLLGSTKDIACSSQR